MEDTFELDGSITTERAAFITKVYGLLTVSVLIAIGGGITSASMFSVRSGMPQMLGLVGFVTLLVTLAMRKVRGLNLGLLFGFSLIEGMAIGPRVAWYAAHTHDPVVTHASITTLGAFLGLTAYVFWSKTDFSYLGGFVWTALWGLIIVGLLSWFVPMGHAVNTLYSYVGVLVFIGFILYDTSNIIRKVPTDEYVHGTIELFLDLVNLFLFILRILGSNRK